MRFIDFIPICICILILFLVILWGVNSDKKIHEDMISFNENIDNIVRYEHCYEIGDTFYCLKDSLYGKDN